MLSDSLDTSFDNDLGLNVCDTYLFKINDLLFLLCLGLGIEGKKPLELLKI